MIIETIIIIVVWTILLIISINSLYQCDKKNKSKISFKESMDLTELPVITFTNNDIKLNFLLDTGSNNSFINKSILNMLDYKELNGASNIIGFEGNKIENSICEMKIEYKDYIFDTTFNIADLDASFNVIKQEDGVQLHGILGSLFFQKYKYVLDFQSLIAYMK